MSAIYQTAIKSLKLSRFAINPKIPMTMRIRVYFKLFLDCLARAHSIKPVVNKLKACLFALSLIPFFILLVAAREIDFFLFCPLIYFQSNPVLASLNNVKFQPVLHVPCRSFILLLLDFLPYYFPNWLVHFYEVPVPPGVEF